MLVRALKDDHSRVVTVAIEALAVVHHMIGDDIQPMLISAGASVSSRLMLAGRFASKDLPGLKPDGAVEHEASVTHIAHALLQGHQVAAQHHLPQLWLSFMCKMLTCGATDPTSANRVLIFS